MDIALCIALPISLHNKFKAAGMNGVLPYNLGIIFSILGLEFLAFALFADSLGMAGGALGVIAGAIIAAVIYSNGKKKVQAEVARRYASGYGNPYGAQPPYGYGAQPPYPPAGNPYGTPPPYGGAYYGQPGGQPPPYGGQAPGQPGGMDTGAYGNTQPGQAPYGQQPYGEAAPSPAQPTAEAGQQWQPGNTANSGWPTGAGAPEAPAAPPAAEAGQQWQPGNTANSGWPTGASAPEAPAASPAAEAGQGDDAPHQGA